MRIFFLGFTVALSIIALSKTATAMRFKSTFEFQKVLKQIPAKKSFSTESKKKIESLKLRQKLFEEENKKLLKKHFSKADIHNAELQGRVFKELTKAFQDEPQIPNPGDWKRIGFRKETLCDPTRMLQDLCCVRLSETPSSSIYSFIVSVGEFEYLLGNCHTRTPESGFENFYKNIKKAHLTEKRYIPHKIVFLNEHHLRVCPTGGHLETPLDSPSEEVWEQVRVKMGLKYYDYLIKKIEKDDYFLNPGNVYVS
ncbi:hypothetical protein Bealeia1_00462 [Candidatus Bealeia paramacronuclearis]|uniref:Uncharacterized protein n=1 Tax=Candidatus Bealeia paramacronuclearis TaxID=1921001 RepID=A0ABZ2C3P1_9PROT|nr:hypothetical protein [Candidatus Bealeia paramacronuclearis]